MEILNDINNFIGKLMGASKGSQDAKESPLQASRTTTNKEECKASKKVSLG